MTNKEAIQELELKKKVHLIQGNTRMVELCDLCIRVLEAIPEIKEIPKDYKYDTETDEFDVYRHKYTGHEIHILKEPPLYRLEVQTCENINEDYADCDQFKCSECQIELQDWHRVERDDDGDISYHEYTFRYCPNCGRRVKYEADN